MERCEAAWTNQSGSLEPDPVICAYERYRAELEAYVVRSFGGRVAPEDVVHEAFARLLRDRAAGRQTTSTRAWLYRVAHNLAVDELRRPIQRGSDHDLTPADEPRSGSAELEFETLAISPELRLALASLGGPARTAILMAAEGYSGREMALTIGRSEVATRALLFRARQAMRGLLEEQQAREGAGLRRGKRLEPRLLDRARRPRIATMAA